MKSVTKRIDLENEAREAIQAVLRQVSTIEIKGTEMKVPDASWEMNFVHRIGVLNCNQALACRVAPSGDALTVRKALREVQQNSATCFDGSIPVIIAPYLSSEMRALCTENKIGYVDLEGNARLLLGEVFISKRSLSRRDHQAAILPDAIEKVSVRKFGPIRLTPAAERALQPVTAA